MTMITRMLQARLIASSKPKTLFSVTFNNHFRAHGRCNTCIQLKLSSNRGTSRPGESVIKFKLIFWVTYLCTDEDLSIKKCVPCDSKDIRGMTEQAANELIPKVPGWNLINEGGTLKLNWTWKVKSFTKGLELFKVVADIAEAEGHHPDLHLVRWNNVKIEIWTHSVGGLTENDFILASKINALDLRDLLSRKAAN